MVSDLSEESPQRFDRPTFPTVHHNTQDVEKLRRVALTGDVHAEIPNLSRIIRLFISSTFKDMSDERDKIMHVIYPKLEKYCSSKGYILQIVDMRWGIFESACNERLTTDICLDEIRLAKELSNGPFFIAILSHRYGSKFSPRSISDTEFDLLLQQCDQNGKILLNKWYDVDKNNIPIIYNLKTLEDDELKSKWEKNDSKLLLDILRNSANAANLDEDALIKYTRSVTELEIEEGIFKTIDCNFRCLAFFRHINVFDQIKSGIIDPKLIDIFNKYVDINQDTKEVDYGCQQMINSLKERIKRKMQRRNVKQFIVGINSISELMQNTLDNENFENYLIEFTDLFERTVVNLVEANINKNEILFHVLENYADLFHHLRFCHEKVKGFMGRHSFIDQIKSLLLEQHIQYIVIHGISGSGKTSLVAKLAEKLKDWFNHIDFVIILRFIGTSEDSYNIQNLLSSIIKQLAHRFDLIIDHEELTPIDKLYNYFKKFLIEVSRECGNEQDIFILLDSLDQLSPEYGGRKLDWFPIGLPKNIRFIISTLTDSHYEAFPAIQNLVKNTSNNYIEITELNEDEIQSAIQYRLDNAQRTLTNIQMQYLLNLFKKCSIPLYIKLVMDQAIKWRHSISMKTITVSDEIKPAIHDLLEKLELSYGIVLVKKVLQYMTLSRHGFFENYLQNILANDQTVLMYIEDQFKNHKFSSGRIPQIFLIRLIHALREYLSGPMYRWYHRAFWEVATDRYCQDVESNQDCHKTIVRTYQYEKFNKSNPFWMNELPYHATCANNIIDLKNNFLLNLKFMQIKAQGSDIDQLIADYDFALNHHHHQDQTLRLVHQVLLIAAYKIRQDPLQLPGQLFGRLYGYEMDTDLQNLLEQCLSPPEDAIISNKRFMAGPNNLLSKSFIAHKTEIKSILISNDNQSIISCSIDNSIKVFDGKTLTEKITIYKNYDSTTALTISNDNTILYAWCRITDEKHKSQPLIEAFNLNTGDHLFDIDSKILHDDPSKHREVLFSDLKNELWLVTKNNWYHLNWQTGIVESVFKLPQEFAQKPDKIICIDKSQDRIVIGLDIESIVLSLNENGNYTLRDLNGQTVMGRKFLILSNRTLAISTRRIFKSIYDDKDMEWNILLCHLESLEIQRRIPVSKALRMWKSSLDSTKIFCNAFNYIYVLDIEKQQTNFILEHSSQMNSCALLNELTIISATWDNKLHVWDLSEAAVLVNQSSQNVNSVNLFDRFNSRMIRFLYDDFNTLSRYVFVYNIFDENFKELFILYDLSTQQITRKCKIDEYLHNDLQPICFISQQFVLLFCLSKKSYYFLDINLFTIIKQFSSDESRVVEKIDPNQVVMSIRNNRDHTNSLVLLDCNLLCCETLIPIWTDIEWCTVNAQTIIYKQKLNPTVLMFKISERHLSVLSLDSGNQPITRVISSAKGKYLTSISICADDPTTKSIKVYKIENIQDIGQLSLSFEKNNLKSLGQIKFVGDEYLVYQHKEGSNRLSYCYDLSNNTSHLWFQDDDSQGSFDCLKHERSKYIWYQRYQVSRMNKVKTDISVFHTQDVSKPVCSLDVDCRLKINQVALFDNGNAMLVKVLDKLEFVAFFLKSKTKNTEENIIHFDSFRLYDSTTVLTLKKSTFYQFCRSFSFIHYANEF
jgi:WD40 repeat protein/nucleoside-triphosphatase THEP1